eukprot:553155-Pelagomonas_calceolata.AAC.1
MLEHCPHPIHFYKVKTHAGIIGNARADACARTAALTDTIDIALPDARDRFHNIYWLSLKASHGQTDGLHRSHAFPIHYLTNLNDKLKVHMHKLSIELSHHHVTEPWSSARRATARRTSPD